MVDNYGDIGDVLAAGAQLSAELGMSVRLWVDDLASFARLCPSLAPSLDAQSIEGIEVQRWDAAALPAVTPAKRVIEAFACNLPEGFVQAMAACQPAPVWINLEYLSAEDWVGGCHGPPSPHPSCRCASIFLPGFRTIPAGVGRGRCVGAARAQLADPAASWAALG